MSLASWTTWTSWTSWVEGWRMDLSDSVRRLVRAPGFTAIAVVSLALGIGANTAIFSIIDAAVLKALPVTAPERLVQLGASDTEFTNPIWEAFRDRQQVLDAPFAWATERLDTATSGEKRPIDGLIVSGGFFPALGVPAWLGRTLTQADDRRGGGPDGPVAVLGHAFWRERYGASPAVLGSTLSLNGHAFTIVGVTPPGFFGLDVGRRFDVAVPLGTEPLLRGKDTRLDRGTMWWLQIMGRLKPGDDLARAQAGVRALIPAIREATRPGGARSSRAGDDDWYLKEPIVVHSAAGGVSGLRERYDTSLVVLMGVVALVLLIVCATLANLLLARATARQQELAVRLALGASRARLVRQALVESLLIAIGGAALGLVFAQWAAPLLLHQLSSRTTRVVLDIGLDWRLLVFTTLAAVLTTVLCGVAPAFGSTRLSANDVLKSRSRAIATGWRGASIEKALVAIQMAVSLVLVVTAAWFVRSFTSLVTLDPGFAREQVLLMQADTVRAGLTADQRRRLYGELLDAIRRLPGVQAAAYLDVTPISGNASQRDVVVESEGGGRPLERTPAVSTHMNRVSPEYFETLRTPLRAGRNFDARDVLGAPAVAIVNETFVRRFVRGANPLGARILYARGLASDPGLLIVGVAADSKYRSLRETTPPTVYLPLTQDPQPFSRANFAIRMWAGGMSASVPAPTPAAPAAAATSASPPAAAVESAPAASTSVSVSASAPPQASASASVSTSPTASASIVPALVAAVRGLHQDVSVELTTLARQVDDSLIRDRMLALLSGFFGALALLVAGLGLYGVLSLAVARRRHELGVRMALGAPPASVRALVLRDILRITLIGLGAGSIAALVAGRIVRSLLFNLEPTDPSTWLLALATLGGVATMAGYLPARRAARIDPVVALREE